MTREGTDVERDKIHIRKNPDAPGKDPALCGRTHAATITEAWGYWGPGGAGFGEVCGTCYTAQIAARGW